MKLSRPLTPEEFARARRFGLPRHRRAYLKRIGAWREKPPKPKRQAYIDEVIAMGGWADPRRRSTRIRVPDGTAARVEKAKAKRARRRDRNLQLVGRAIAADATPWVGGRAA